MKTIMLLISGLFLVSSLAAQPCPIITIHNETVDGTDYYFDVLIENAADADTDLLLGISDFVFDFDPALFDSPCISQITGFCGLLPASATGNHVFTTQLSFESSLITTVHNSEIRLNLNGLLVTDIVSLENRIARVDASAYRLGRFKVTGFQGETIGDVGLHLKKAPDAVSSFFTKITTIQKGGYFLHQFVPICDTPESELVGIEELEEGADSPTNWAIFPNPTTDKITVMIDDFDPKTVEIYSINGRLVSTLVSSDSRIEINTSQWSSGTYFAKYKDTVIRFLKVE